MLVVMTATRGRSGDPGRTTSMSDSSFRSFALRLLWLAIQRLRVSFLSADASRTARRRCRAPRRVDLVIGRFAFTDEARHRSERLRRENARLVERLTVLIERRR